MALVLEYVFEGHKRGYNFTSSTQVYDDDTLRHIWRGAMPRGQGWRDYMGATSLKCFPLDDRRVVVSDVTVTDLADERGRQGIRRAEIEVIAEADYVPFLQKRLESYPSEIRQRAENKLTICRRTDIIARTLPKFRRDAQLVLVRPYEKDWQVLEAFVLMLVLHPVIAMRRWMPVIPFTTLALDHREEAAVVGIPAAKAETLDVPQVRVG